MAKGPVTIHRAIGEMTFDATFQESHASDLEVTDKPIETGSLVSDHAFMKPLRVEITAGVSDILTPSGNPAYGGGSGRAQTAFQLLTDLQKSAEPFIVQTGLKVYENMVCESIRAAQDTFSAHILYFTASLREVLIVETQSTTYTQHPQAKKRVNRGEVQGRNLEKQQADAYRINAERANEFLRREGKNPNNGTRDGGGQDVSIAHRALAAVKGAESGK